MRWCSPAMAMAAIRHWSARIFPKWPMPLISVMQATRAMRSSGATALGARLSDMSAYQGHGSVAHPHGILISWASMSEGGFQINLNGRRFSDESLGYSEQAERVLAQKGRRRLVDLRCAHSRYHAPVRGFSVGGGRRRGAKRRGCRDAGHDDETTDRSADRHGRCGRTPQA